MDNKKALNKGRLGNKRRQRGLAMVEYALAGGLVGVGIIAAFAALGVEIGEVIDAIVQLITDAVS